MYLVTSSFGGCVHEKVRVVVVLPVTVTLGAEGTPSGGQ